MVRFYNKRGTAEQWIKEGKLAITWDGLDQVIWKISVYIVDPNELEADFRQPEF